MPDGGCKMADERWALRDKRCEIGDSGWGMRGVGCDVIWYDMVCASERLVVFGTRSLALGTWYLVLGSWSLIVGIGYLIWGMWWMTGNTGWLGKGWMLRHVGWSRLGWDGMGWVDVLSTKIRGILRCFVVWRGVLFGGLWVVWNDMGGMRHTVFSACYEARNSWWAMADNWYGVFDSWKLIWNGL